MSTSVDASNMTQSPATTALHTGVTNIETRSADTKPFKEHNGTFGETMPPTKRREEDVTQIGLNTSLGNSLNPG